MGHCRLAGIDPGQHARHGQSAGCEPDAGNPRSDRRSVGEDSRDRQEKPACRPAPPHEAVSAAAAPQRRCDHESGHERRGYDGRPRGLARAEWGRASRRNAARRRGKARGKTGQRRLAAGAETARAQGQPRRRRCFNAPAHRILPISREEALYGSLTFSDCMDCRLRVSSVASLSAADEKSDKADRRKIADAVDGANGTRFRSFCFGRQAHQGDET